MRFYGIRSGRNNISRLIARSIMFNSPKKNYRTVNNSVKMNDEALGIFIIIVVIVCLIVIL